MDEMQRPLKRRGKKGRRKKRKEIILTPRQRFEQAVALKRAVRCILRAEDKYFVYTKLTEDFAGLAALPEEQAFEGQEECTALSEECRALAEELKSQVSDEPQEDTRTVTRTVKLREQSGRQKGKAKWGLLAAVVIVAGIILAFHIDGSRYTIAFIEKGLGFKDEALEMFQSLPEYKDSESQAARMEQILLDEARKGDVVAFGKQKWIVLDKNKKNSSVCLMKLDGEKKLLYHPREEKVNWETCDVRTYLNTDYLQKRFTPEEQSMILTTEVPAAVNAAYPVDSGNATKDKIFILSSREVKKYKKILSDRGNNMRLRTPGKEEMTTEFVSGLGEVVEYGYPVNKPGVPVHPVMWVTVKE